MSLESHPNQAATTLARKTDEHEQIELSSFRLDVVHGPDVGLSMVLEASGAVEALVGTSASCEIRLTDPLASRRHARVVLEPGRLRVVDLDSTNGTRVGNLEVHAVALRGGEVIEIGDTKLTATALSAVTRARLPSTSAFGGVLGRSPAMRRVYAVAERLAHSDVPVILEGETGTGKEVLAEALHEASGRASGPFVVFDCTLGPASLLDDALFGHERGAFTGATAPRAGVFERAHGGTLLLDEIGDLDLALQAKLLRAVQDKRVQRLGSSAFINVDVRIIAATRRDLDQAIQRGQFRDDLYYRLAVARLRLPPLRERAGDVRLLAESFWAQLTKDPYPDDLAAHLERHDFPGNVRELKNAVAHRLALGDLAEPESLALPRPAGLPAKEGGSDPIAAIVTKKLPFAEARRLVLATFESAYLTDVLLRHGGNITKAATAAGIARRYFYELKARHGEAER